MADILIYALLLAIFLFEWLFVVGLGSRVLAWTPEIVSFILMIYIPLRAMKTKRFGLSGKYIILWTLYSANVFCGFLINGVSAGPMFAGMRVYFKFIPMFFLPFLVEFDEKRTKRLLRLIMIGALIQLPVTTWQRFFAKADRFVGDFAGGTIGYNTSGVLALFLMSVMCFLVTFYLSKRIGTWHFVIGAIALLAPNMMNETKISFVLLPFAFILPTIILILRKRVTKRIVIVGIFCAGSFIVFVSVYNLLIEREIGPKIEEYLTKPEILDEYADRRLMPILAAIKHSTKDTKEFFFGYGAGNVSESFTEGLKGRYGKAFAKYRVGQVAFTQLIWEIGLFGVFVFFSIVVMVFFDALRCSSKMGFWGAFCLGMVCCCGVFGFSFFYSAILNQNIAMYIFFLLAGIVASQRQREIRAAGQESAAS
ncbi:MAG: hypothetical protein ACNY01_07780 [Desulfobacteria bacterium]